MFLVSGSNTYNCSILWKDAYFIGLNLESPESTNSEHPNGSQFDDITKQCKPMNVYSEVSPMVLMGLPLFSGAFLSGQCVQDCLCLLSCKIRLQ